MGLANDVAVSVGGTDENWVGVEFPLLKKGICGCVAQMIESLPGKHEALSSSPDTTKKAYVTWGVQVNKSLDGGSQILLVTAHFTSSYL
jgi:hypothetical protein